VTFFCTTEIRFSSSSPFCEFQKDFCSSKEILSQRFMYIYIHMHIHIYIYVYILLRSSNYQQSDAMILMKNKKMAALLKMVTFCYGVAKISRLLIMLGLFCKRALLKRRYSAKKTYNFKKPTN